MWDFDHPPRAAVLAERYDVQSMMPSECAAQLASGDADLGLVPIAAFPEMPALRMVPGCAIASMGAIRSLILVYRESLGLDGIRTIAADTSSRATLAYVRILACRYWKIAATFLPHPPQLDAMLAAADAAVLIGDPALLALEDQQARYARTGDRLVYLDLGAEWNRVTGLPWISAVWGVRESVVVGSRDPYRLINDLIASRDAGLAHLDDLAKEWSARIAVPRDIIRSYLGSNIHYSLDDECLAGMRHFFTLAAECGVLPAFPSLPLLSL